MYFPSSGDITFCQYFETYGKKFMYAYKDLLETCNLCLVRRHFGLISETIYEPYNFKIRRHRIKMEISLDVLYALSFS